jgi:hypothetical protein
MQQSLGLLTTPLAKDCCRTGKFKYAKGVVRSPKDCCRTDKFKYAKELLEAIRTVAGQTSHI